MGYMCYVIGTEKMCQKYIVTQKVCENCHQNQDTKHARMGSVRYIHGIDILRGRQHLETDPVMHTLLLDVLAFLSVSVD